MAGPAPRTVLVTGCSSGIGLAVAVRLAQDPQRRFQGEEGGPSAPEILWGREGEGFGVPPSCAHPQQGTLGVSSSP